MGGMACSSKDKDISTLGQKEGGLQSYFGARVALGRYGIQVAKVSRLYTPDGKSPCVDPHSTPQRAPLAPASTLTQHPANASSMPWRAGSPAPCGCGCRSRSAAAPSPPPPQTETASTHRSAPSRQGRQESQKPSKAQLPQALAASYRRGADTQLPCRAPLKRRSVCLHLSGHSSVLLGRPNSFGSCKLAVGSS